MTDAQMIEHLRALLEDAAEILEDYADVDDGNHGEPAPNKAMSMAMRIRSELP